MHQMAQLQQAVECPKAASEGAEVNQDSGTHVINSELSYCSVSPVLLTLGFLKRS